MIIIATDYRRYNFDTTIIGIPEEHAEIIGRKGSDSHFIRGECLEKLPRFHVESASLGASEDSG